MLLGADAMISGDRPLPESFSQTAVSMGLKVTESTRFGSMISAAAKDGAAVAARQSVLSDVKAVAAPYPLRGTLEARNDKGERVAARGAGEARRGVCR